MKIWRFGLGMALLVSSSTFANPYWDLRKVPRASSFVETSLPRASRTLPRLRAISAATSLRVLVAWHPDETYSLAGVALEASGTEAFGRRARVRPTMGSYVAKLLDASGRTLAYDAIGTGKEFRKLVREITFRFPLPASLSGLALEVWAEHPDHGRSERVFAGPLSRPEPFVPSSPEVRLLREARRQPSLVVNVYSEGYLANFREKFFADAQKVVRAFEENAFEGSEHFELRAVFEASPVALGNARKLGTPIPEYASNLGLFFPYWADFGRWYHVVYPTRQEKYRRQIGRVPYDYPIVLVNDRQYWGVGNYRELTAIPSDNASFTYLLLHEFGHYMGLNEEYEGGGRTELEFAPGLAEPWSPNLSFLRSPTQLKWQSFLSPSTPVPTPANRWRDGVWGAYRGGYADSPVRSGHAHKPGFSCVMDRGPDFCAICSKALADIVRFDLGLGNGVRNSGI